MNYYGDGNNGMTTITCPMCKSFNAKCNTNMLLTSEPPQYGFSCPDCNHHGYIYSYELTKYTASATLVSSETTNALEEKVKTLEDRIAKLEQMVETLKISIVNVSQALILY